MVGRQALSALLRARRRAGRGRSAGRPAAADVVGTGANGATPSLDGACPSRCADLRPAVVEPLIALSIAYVAIETLSTSTLRPSRLALVFGFGLLHGMGFAGVLKALGFPASRSVSALLSFNAGVELGQLAVIGGATIAVCGWGRRHTSWTPVAARPASAAIAISGVCWTIQRLWQG